MFCSIPCIQHETPPWVVSRCLLPAPEDTLVMLWMTPGRRAEGVRVATALGSFDLTVHGVRKNAIRWVGTVEFANGLML
jgi:hypothetical protein